MNITNNFISTTVSRIYLIILILFMIFSAPQNICAIEPDDTLYSEKTEEREAVYRQKAQQLTDKIDAAIDDKEKQNLLIQQQLLIKLQELPESPELPSIDLNFSELDSPKTTSWQEVEQYLERYVNLIKEGKTSGQNLENTNKQVNTLYNRITALAEDSSEVNFLQLQYAYQNRKLAQQTEIDKQLREGLERAKKQYSTVLEYIHIDQQMTDEQAKILVKAEQHLQQLEDEKILAAAGDDVLIEQQKNLLAGYLGQDLDDDGQKTMHYQQLKLLKQQVEKFTKDNRIEESKVVLFEEEQKTLWYRLLGTKPDYFKLVDLSGDINKKVLRFRKKTVRLLDLIHTYEKELSTLRGGNALIGPKSQELITALDENVQKIFTQLSGMDQKAEMLENKGRLLDRAIDLKQSTLGSMVTKALEVTDNLYEKGRHVIKHPLLTYNGMSISLLLLLQVTLLLLLGIIINRLYGYVVLRIGKKQNWSERTTHLIQAGGKYPFIFIIAMIILSVIGINTRSLALVAGALSVGIGFGMQTIVNNLVSGIILLFDKSIRPGDFISLGEGCQPDGLRGNVVQMNIRATVLRTNDNINIIIPNADLMASQVVNWTYGDEKIRFRIPFSVAYGSDIDKVKSIIRETVVALPVVLSRPEPQILMTEHGESSLSLVAAIWVEGQNSRRPARTFDFILSAIYKALNEHNIEIPFPQMDLRLRSSELQPDDITVITDALRQKLRQKPSSQEKKDYAFVPST